MIDLHTHILPCMDDGSAGVDESEKMLKELRSQGVELVVATPHYHAQNETPQEFLLRRQIAFEKMRWQDEKILPAAEVAYFSGISRCEELPLLCIRGTRLVLLEMPFGAWNHATVEEVGMINRRLGLIPVLAHVDRYRELPNFKESVMNMLHDGILLQCNAQALLSPLSGRKWMRMICDGEIHFLGSDCHDMNRRPPNIGKVIRKLEKKLGNRQFREFCDRAEELLKL